MCKWLHIVLFNLLLCSNILSTTTCPTHWSEANGYRPSKPNLHLHSSLRLSFFVSLRGSHIVFSLSDDLLHHSTLNFWFCASICFFSRRLMPVCSWLRMRCVVVFLFLFFYYYLDPLQPQTSKCFSETLDKWIWSRRKMIYVCQIFLPMTICAMPRLLLNTHGI